MNLKRIREARGLTQLELAQKSGVSQGKICEYEAGKVIPRVDSAQKIAEALECTIDDLVRAPKNG